MSASRPPLWLFDLGNTRLKGRWSCAGTVGGAVEIEWSNADFERTLRAALDAWPRAGRVLVASVAAAERALHLRAVLARWPHLEAEWLVSPRRGCGIVNSYRYPERLGIDRFLAMAGAHAASPGKPVLVVGCGTALTLDALDAGGGHVEGLIVPSPDLMQRSLQAGTAIAETNPGAFHAASDSDPDDTRCAIRAGCWRAAVALVDAFRRRHQGAAADVTLWLCGGGAGALQTELAHYGAAPGRRLDDAVWRGLEVWAASQSAPLAAP